MRPGLVPLAAVLALAFAPARAAVPGEADLPPLGWEDFRGTPPEVRVGAVAQIVYEFRLRCRYRISPAGEGFVASLEAFEVELVLRRDLSWAYPWARTPEVLRHERGHLGIAEVYRRALAAALRGLSAHGPTGDGAAAALSSSVQGIFRGVQERMERTQRAYDAATAHGRDPRAQAEWLGTIAAWLADPGSAP